MTNQNIARWEIQGEIEGEWRLSQETTPAATEKARLVENEVTPQPRDDTQINRKGLI